LALNFDLRNRIINIDALEEILFSGEFWVTSISVGEEVARYLLHLGNFPEGAIENSGNFSDCSLDHLIQSTRIFAASPKFYVLLRLWLLACEKRIAKR